MGRIKPALMAASEQEARSIYRAMSACLEVVNLATPLGQRIMVVAPHPDDETLGPGGLILMHRGSAEIHELVVFNGEGGGGLPGARWRDTVTYKGALAAHRRDELEAAAAKLGVASVDYLGLKDNGPIETFAYGATRAAVERFRPDVVLLPWYLDEQRDHRAANALWAESCGDLDCMVVAYEVWGLLPANGILDISPVLDEKIEISRTFTSQNEAIDYPGYVDALARVRGFQHGTDVARGVEAYFSMPNRDYCALVRAIYGTRGARKVSGLALHLDQIESPGLLRRA